MARPTKKQETTQRDKTLDELSAVSQEIGMYEEDEMLAAAWLHDVLEDTPVTHSQLYQEFGDTVTTICYLLNKNNSLPYDFDYPKYIKEIKLCYESKIVKMADTIANLEASILSGELKRVNKYSKQLALLTEV